ncbi:threonine/serine dehydratase [Albidovulum sediminicola]|uniref:Pyridoxal-phosphate dependent enzyme n=1 Tax=Albidovulum sediminicola TaxID=2984331 RepID=A0ABT2Z282_9RHOB|nr:pyridoxal-phosphate dependent enzyme [Defluviimonas sp. WL0075]MCV2865205.1 pyridoxal-phosphate dependent enzyme [Defluviimonas sp. WL0075]
MIPTPAELAAAFATTRERTQRTPLIAVPALAEATGAAAAFVKAESLQTAGSFKIRGATWRLTRLSPEERRAGVVAYSSGNFAQGLAAAGQAEGVPVTIVMPVDAPEAKRRATEALGARVVLSHHGDRPREEAASALAREIAAAEGLVLLHPFDDPAIVAGQAGAALEALEQLVAFGARADVVACPVGGGGLIGGVSLAFHHADPQARVIAVEPEGYDGMGQSLAAGERRRVASGGATICDALQATEPGEAPFAAARHAGVRGLAVGDAEVRGAMRFAFERLKLVLEPSGAVALAAALSGRLPVDGKNLLVFVTGGNVAFDRFAAILAQQD